MNDATPKRMILAELTTQNPIPPALNVVQGIVECKSGLFRGRTTLYTEAGFSCTFAGQGVQARTETR